MFLIVANLNWLFFVFLILFITLKVFLKIFKQRTKTEIIVTLKRRTLVDV